MNRLKLPINLDDEYEVQDFIAVHGQIRGRALAARLGLIGLGSVRAATALSCYAWNKMTAISLRKQGNINRALYYEKICDRIYTTNILPFIECW